jgi:hypothetical protein
MPIAADRDQRPDDTDADRQTEEHGHQKRLGNVKRHETVIGDAERPVECQFDK